MTAIGTQKTGGGRARNRDSRTESPNSHPESAGRCGLIAVPGNAGGPPAGVGRLAHTRSAARTRNDVRGSRTGRTRRLGAGLVQALAGIALLVFLAACLRTCVAIRRGDPAISPEPLALGGALLAASTVFLLDSARRARLRMARLRRLATRDAVTGALNRAAIVVRARAEARAAARTARPLLLVIADLDRFKETNDSHGHAAGDLVLRAAARRLATLHKGAVVGRFGGDEFLVLVPGATAAQVPAFAGRTGATITFPVVIPGATLDVSLSLGAAVLEGRDASLLPRLLRQADLALYAAKPSRSPGSLRTRAVERPAAPRPVHQSPRCAVNAAND